MQKFFLLLCLICCPLICHADEEMPIVAYIGVPDWRTTDEDFKAFAECGFNISIHSYSSLDVLVKACRIAEKYGVRIIGECRDISEKPKETASILRHEKGFYAYMMKDEPSAVEIRQLEKDMNLLKSVDRNHNFYINLLPNYHPDWIEPSRTVKTYPEYLRTLTKTPCRQLSFDYYPITSKGIRSTWYRNLEMIRKESLESGKPFWAFVLSMPHDVPYMPDTYYPQPTITSLRLQAYVNLAYGAQAIQYFTYWTPGDVQGFHFHDAPMSPDGKKTKIYWIVKQMNLELKPLLRLFYGAHSLSVRHLGAIPEGARALTEAPLNIGRLKILGKPGAVVSEFEKNGHRYLAIVNKSHKQHVKVQITAKNETPCFVTKKLQEQPMKSSYSVPAGDMILFRLN